MGTIVTPVTVSNVHDPTKRVTFDGFVDTGATFLTLPNAWREKLGEMEKVENVEMELASGELRLGEVGGPARVRIGGFREVFGEVSFMEMEPDADGNFEPLIGYLPLEAIPAGVDMLNHRLFKSKVRAK